MKTSFIAALAAAAFLPLSALAQSESAGPSPTESVGCEPHGDHWHCEGPRETAAAEEDVESADPGPSPTASVGCEPHGDHWHCEGPNTTLTGASSSETADEDEDDHDHDHEEDHDHDHEEDHDHDHDEDEAAEAGPSPTESVGCEPHGDHWHCDGPKETSDMVSPTPSSGSGDSSDEEGGDDDSGAAGLFAPVAGLIAAAVFAL